MKNPMVIKTYEEYDAFFYSGKCNFPFIKIWNKFIDFERNSKVNLKDQLEISTIQTFKLSKQKVSSLVVLAKHCSILDYDIHFQLWDLLPTCWGYKFKSLDRSIRSLIFVLVNVKRDSPS